MKKTLLTLLFVLTLSTPLYSDSVTLSTYIPAPFGSFDQLRLVPRAPITCDASMDGLIINDNSTNPSVLKICANSTLQALAGLWSQTGTDLYPNDLTVSVGIGTQTPFADLEVLNDGADSTIMSTSFGTGNPGLVGRAARGSEAAPAASQPDDTLLFIGARGYGSTGFSGNSKAAIILNADQNWTNTAQGTHIRFETTANDTTLRDEQMRIDNQGNVGIGTQAPWEKLVVAADGDADIDLSVADSVESASIHFRRSHGTHASPTPPQASENIGNIEAEIWDGSDYHDAARINLRTETGITPASGSTPGKIVFSTTPEGSTSVSERMRIDSQGNVGIGTQSPTSHLQVEGQYHQDLRVKSTLSSVVAELPTAVSIGAGNTNPYIEFSEDDYLQFISAPHDETGDGNGPVVMSVGSSPLGSKVGIGTDNPREKFQIGSHFTFHDGGYKIISRNTYYGGSPADDRRISNDEVAAMAFTDDGDIIFRTAPAGAADSVIAGGTWWTPPLRIQNNGFIGIGDTTPDVELDVIGDINYTGDITDVSDERLKENIEIIRNPIAKLQNIEGYYYNMIGSEKKELGVSAQDVQKSFPEAVRTVDEENGYLGVSYPTLVPVLIEAIKELKNEKDAEIELLKNENKILKTELDDLKTRMNDMTERIGQ